MNAAILKRELEILTTVAGWPFDDAIEFLKKSAAKAGGGAETFDMLPTDTLEEAGRTSPGFTPQPRLGR